jgi:hypothetical protein
LNADLSAAPEIARLALPFVPVQQDAVLPRTVGQLAGDLTELAATPERWWDLVRFDPRGPLRIPVPASPGTWLLVAPPDADAYCDCRYATLLAGEAGELEAGEIEAGRIEAGRIEAGRIEAGNASASGIRPLRSGRVRVHGTGTGHRLRTGGLGFSVTLHSGTATTRSF